MPCKPQLSKVFSIIGIVVGAAIIVAGAIMPTIIESMIEQTIKTAVPLSQEDKSEESWNDFITDVRYKNFYFYHITNLPQVISMTPAPVAPNFEERGPYRYTWTVKKVDWSFNTAKTEYTYLEYETFTLLSAPTVDGDNEQLVTVNPLYVGATNKMGGEFPFMFYAASKVFSNLQIQFLNDTESDLIAMNKFLAFGGVFGYALQQLVAAPAPWSDIKLHWADYVTNGLSDVGVSAGATLDTVDSSFGFFEFNHPGLLTGLLDSPPAASNTLPVGSALFTSNEINCIFGNGVCNDLTANPAAMDVSIYSFATTGQGIYLWMGAAMDAEDSFSGCNMQCDTACATDVLMCVYSQNAVMALIKYITTAAVVQSNDWIFPVYAGGLGALCGSLSSWIDVGACQFGKSGVTLAMNAAYDSLADIPNINTMPGTESLLDAPEYIPGSGDSAGLSVAYSKVFLSTFSSLTSIIGFCSMPFATLPADVVQPANQWLADAGLTATNVQFAYLYVCWYAPTKLFVHSMLVGATTADGAGIIGQGLFQRRTVNELLFGWTFTAFGMYFPGVAGPVFPNEAAFLAFPFKAGHHTVYTGTDDVSKLYQYKEWKGLSAAISLQSQLTWMTPCVVQAGSTPNPLTFGGHRKDCKLWNTAETLTGLTGGNFYGRSFNEDDTPKANFEMVASPIYRRVNMVFDGKEDLKGLKVWRYILDPNLLKMSHSTAANYWMDECDGLQPLQSAVGVPFYASTPGFGGATAGCLGVTKTGDWDGPTTSVPHTTYIQFEPLSGLALAYRLRLQMSVKLTKSCDDGDEQTAGRFCNNWNFAFDPSHLGYYYGVLAVQSRIFVPYFWIQEEKEIEQADASKLSDAIYGNRDMGSYMMYSLVPVGTVVLIASVVILLLRLRAPAQVGTAPAAAATVAAATP
jgi:hypothetical protein